MLAFDYKQHRCALIKKSSMGWSAELHLYLNEIAEDVTRDTDVIDWWGLSIHAIVSHLFILIFSKETLLDIPNTFAHGTRCMWNPSILHAM